MAEEIAIQGSPEGAQAKIRSPLGVVVLTFVTLGIYGLYWWYKINKEMADYGKAKGTDELGDNPTLSLLALFPGFLLLFIPPLVSYYRGWGRLKAAGRLSGRGDEANGWIALILFLLLGFVYPAYVQSDLNKTWEAQAAGGQGSIAPGPAVPDASQPGVPATGETGGTGTF